MSIISMIGAGGMAAAIAGLAAKAGHTVEVITRGPVKAQALAERLGGGAARRPANSVWSRRAKPH